MQRMQLIRRWLEDRNRRALSVLFAAVFLYLAISEVALPVVEKVRTAADNTGQRAAQLRKFRQAVARKGSGDFLLAAARKRVVDLHGRFMDSANPVIASGELQLIVENIAKDTGISFAQRSIVPARRQDKLTSEVAMAVAFESSPAQMIRFLSGLRASPKFLKVTAVQISPLQPVRAVPPTGDLKKNVRASLTIAALFLGVPDPKAGKP